jgi:glycosyltransferase involved in cell wall biosynthesis
MTLQVLSLYPLTDVYRRRLEAQLGEPLHARTLGEFRHPSLWATWKALWGLRQAPLILASEDPTARAVRVVLVTLGGLFGKGSLRYFDHELKETRPSAWEAPLGLLRILGDSLRARWVNRHLLRELASLEGRWRPVPWRGGRRVAYLKTNLWFGVKAGGSVGHVAGVINALARTGHEVEVLANEPQPLVGTEIPTFPIEPPSLCAYPSELNLVAYHRAFLDQARARFQTQRPEWIYQRLSTSNYVGAILSREFDLPLVVEYNGSEVWIAKNWGNGLRNESFALQAEDAMLRQATVVVAVSEVLGEELVARGIPPERVFVHPNCVDPVLFRPDLLSPSEREAARAGLGIAADAVVLTFIGTFGPWHGVELLVEALRELTTADPAWWEARMVHVLMVGDGALRPQAEAGLAGIPRVTFTGLVPQAEAPRILACSDVFLSPHQDRMTGQRFFGSPTKLFEYLAMGRAVLASRLEQIGDICYPALAPEGTPTGAEVAMLFPPGDAAALIRGLRRLVEDGDLRARLGQQGHARALAHYTWDRYVEHLEARLTELGALPPG